MCLHGDHTEFLAGSLTVDSRSRVLVGYISIKHVLGPNLIVAGCLFVSLTKSKCSQKLKLNVLIWVRHDVDLFTTN